jgi:tetratricopeptide (TPR) repeat protein
VYGVVTKLGRTFVITATLIDLNTNETMGGVPIQMNSIEEAFEKMDAPIMDMVQRLTKGGGQIASAFTAQTAASHVERGKMFFDRRDYDLAVAEFTEAVRLNPNDAAAYAGRGSAYAAKGDNDAAIADANQSLRLDPNNAVAYYARARAYGQKGDYDRAIADNTQAIRINPDFANAYFCRGIAYHNKGDYDRAIADYEQTLKIDPNHPYAKESLEEVRKLRRR